MGTETIIVVAALVLAITAGIIYFEISKNRQGSKLGRPGDEGGSGDDGGDIPER